MMFMKVINVDELIEELEQLQPQADEYNHDDSAYWGARDMYDDVMYVIESMEKHGYIDRPHGKWRRYESMLSCMNCGAEFYDDIIEYLGDKLPKFCPECGADMRGEDDE